MEELCPYCGKPLGPDGNCYNQDCKWYDPVSQYDTAEIECQMMQEEASQDYYDAAHAQEFMERNPYGYYNSESDYGCDSEENADEE